MKVWKATLVIGVSDEYNETQIKALDDWFSTVEDDFKRDFSYIRLMIGVPEYVGTVPVEEKSYSHSRYIQPKNIKKWQEEADSNLEKLVEKS